MTLATLSRAPGIRDEVAALKARDIRLLTYRQLIDMHGLQVMRRPGG